MAKSKARGERNFLKSLICVFCGLLILGNCPGSRAGAASGADTVDPAMPMTQKLHEILNYGIAAPSSHNAQMWQAAIVSENEILVTLDPAHTLPQVDPNDREAFISLGAFIENMVEAAPRYNLAAAVRLLARQPGDKQIAKLSFAPQAGTPAAMKAAENIKNRHTLRTPFLKTTLKEADLRRLLSLNRNIAYFPLGSAEGQYLQTAIVQATRQQVADDAKQRELAGMMRFSKKEAAAKKDGLTPEMMGLSGIAKWFVSTFFNHDTVMTPSFRKQTVNTVARQAQNCAGFFIVASPDDSAEALLNAGRTLEQLWIQATAMRIAVHPMSAPLEESPWQGTIASKLGIAGKIQMILRVGYVKDYGKPVSQRRPLP